MSWCYEGTELIDARWTTTQKNSDAKVMIVIQYKYTSKDKRDDIRAEGWAKRIIRELSPHFEDYMIIPVLITNCSISENEQLTNSTPFVFVSRETAGQYFSPNILPLYLLATKSGRPRVRRSMDKLLEC